MGSFSPIHWLVVLAIVLLIFGTKRLRGAGRDLGEAIKGFKKGMNESEAAPQELSDQSRTGENTNQSQQNTENTHR